MRSVLSSSPPGAPRSIVSALSMLRPAYMAAQSPAGPAPTMITSNPLPAFCLIRAKLQSRGGSLPRQGPRELRAKVDKLELDVRPLRPAELLQRGRADDAHTVPVAAPQVQQGGRCLDQPLPDAGRVRLTVRNYRTPDGFQSLVGFPIRAGIEQIAGVCQDRLAFVGSHLR